MANLKTAEQMLRYCTENEIESGTIVNRNLRHFEVIQDNLKPGEVAVEAFTGLMNGFNYAFAITGERIIIAQKKFIGEQVKSVSLKTVNDITLKKGPLHGFIEIDSLREKIIFSVGADYADNVHQCLHRALDLFNGATMSTAASTPRTSSADEILKYKQLLDVGAITQHEFESKKKQLLGL